MTIIRFDDLDKLTPSSNVKLPALEGVTKGHVLASELVGQTGLQGDSAYQVAVDNGFSGSEADWLISLNGEDGDNGNSAYAIALINGFVGTETEWIESLNGDDGSNGLSAYELAVSGGYSGAESEWLESLNGDNGSDGLDAAPTSGYVFADDVERDAFTAWEGLVSIQIDTDSLTQYKSSAWIAYTDISPFYFVGSIDSATVDGHLPNGSIYDEVVS